MKKIGIVGLGMLGYAVALHLLDSGFEVTVYNRTKEKAAQLIKKGAKASLIRNNEILGVGTIPQLQQNKQDISEVQEGSECGLMFVPEDSKVKVQQGDILEIFEQKTINPTLNK